jgi:hypothetical protein
MTTPTLTNFVIPFKRINDSSFLLVDPSSNSPGSFVFTSGSQQVATINNRTVTIVGIGTSIITATQAASGSYASGSITASFVVKGQLPVITNFVIPTRSYNDPSTFTLVDPTSNSAGAFTYISDNENIATIVDKTVTTRSSGTTSITARQAASTIYDTIDVSALLVVLPPPPTWYPNLIQNANGNLDITGTTYPGDNTYNLSYSSTYTLNDIDVQRLPPFIRGPNLRPTGIGVLPMIEITSTNDNSNCPILYDCSDNRFAVTILHLDTQYFTAQQLPLNDPRYDSGNVKPYRDVIIINGLLDSSNSIYYNSDFITLTIYIKQAAGISSRNVSYAEKIVRFPFTITAVPTNISLKSITTTPLPSSLLGSGGSGYIIEREYLQGSIDLSFAEFATTDRLLINGNGFDYSNIYYYLIQTTRNIFVFQNEYVSIENNRITLLNATYSYNINSPTDNPTYDEIPILFYQEASPAYKRSQFIGDTLYSPPLQRETIKLRIVKSTPTFRGQTPSKNTGDPRTVYTLENITKMTYDEPFEIISPGTDNTDASNNFTVVSSLPDIIKIKVENGKNMAYIYNAGVVTITITQTPTRNFKSKTVSFIIYVNLISPSLINCNTNIVYTNPYQRQFWTRFKGPCPDYKLSITNGGGQTRMLTPTEVDDIYSERRKTEILKYSKNVGGLTKSQKYAKASRGELMRQIGNENKYLRGANGNLICPIQPNRVSCGLTSACGVPGKERVLCYDPSINLYNLTRTYEYKGGQQTVSNIPTIALTQPRNLTADLSGNKIILKWDSPISNGGLPITGYVISYSINNKTWDPYISIFPNKDGLVDQISGERNGNTVIFQDISGSISIKNDTIYYISAFSANERGLSSVPATVTIKTSSSPSIISDFGLYDVDRKFLIIDLKWTDPENSTSSTGGYNGPPITQYKIDYKTDSEKTWISTIVDSTSVISDPTKLISKKYTLRNLLNELTYNIKIEAINSVGIGPESKILRARTLMKPGPPLNIVVTSHYGIPPDITGIGNTSINYIIVKWDRPDNGGSTISSYNITITGVETKLYPVGLTSQPTSYSYFITTLNSKFIDIGTYSISLTSKNSMFTSISSSLSSITIAPISVKLTIIEPVVIRYNRTTLSGIVIQFSVSTYNSKDNPITNIRVHGLGNGTNTYETIKNIDNQNIIGSGEHTILVPSSADGNTLLQVGNTYNIYINAKFGSSNYTNDTQSSSLQVRPQIKLS